MKKLLLTTTALAALVAAQGIVSAQSPGSGNAAPGASQSAPSGGMKEGGAGGAASEHRSGAGGAAESPGKPGQDRAQSHQERNTGQARERDPSPTTQRGDNEPRQGERNKSQTQREGEAGDRKSGQGTSDRQNSAEERNGKGRETTGSAPSGSVAISTEQRTRIKEHRSAFAAGRVSNVNFSISVGTTVPRSVTLHAIPSTVIEVVPAWRSYRYVMVEEEIIIIDPTTYRIVAVIDA